MSHHFSLIKLPSIAETLIEISHEAILVCDGDLNVLVCNSNSKELFGYSITDEESSHLSRCFPEEKILQKLKDQFTLNEGRMEVFPAPAVTNLSHTVLMELKVKRVDEILIINVKPVSGKEPLTMLEEYVKQRHLIMENVPVGVYVSNLKGEILLVNKVLVKLFEFENENDMISSGAITRYKNKNKRDEFITLLQQNSRVQDFELEVITNKNKVIFISMSAQLIGDKIVGSVLDITERRKSQERIKRYENLVNQSLNEIYIFDADSYVFNDVNPAALNNLGYSLEEMRCMTPLDIKDKYSLDDFANMVAPLKEGKKDKIVFETDHKRKDGTYYNVEVHLQLLEEGGSRFMAIILDTTERKNLERESQIADIFGREKERKRIAENLHSGLKSVLNTIKLGLDELENTIENADIETQQLISNNSDLVDEAIDELNAVIDNIIPPNLKSEGLVGSIKALCRKVSISQGIKMTVNQSINSLNLEESDELEMYRIIQELISNAVKHSSASQIDVEFLKTNGTLKVDVIDNGVGFPELRSKKGDGLKKIIDKIKSRGGKVNIETSPMQGAKVSLSIPV